MTSTELLLLKLILTPLLIASATLAGRRWGPSLSGWLVGLPFTSGPVAFFLAVDHGAHFAAVAAAGTLAGTISQAAFCLAYAWLALSRSWVVCLAGGCAAFGIFTALLDAVSLPLLGAAVLVVLALIGALRLFPAGAGTSRVSAVRPPRWDLAARLVVATSLVLLLTGVAPLLGPHLAGLLTPFPLYAAVLTVFGHQQLGRETALGVLRGLLMGLYGFAGFFVVLALLLPRNAPIAFVGALATVLTVQAISLRVIHEQGRPFRDEHGVPATEGEIRSPLRSDS